MAMAAFWAGDAGIGHALGAAVRIDEALGEMVLPPMSRLVVQTLTDRPVAGRGDVDDGHVLFHLAARAADVRDQLAWVTWITRSVGPGWPRRRGPAAHALGRLEAADGAEPWRGSRPVSYFDRLSPTTVQASAP